MLDIIRTTKSKVTPKVTVIITLYNYGNYIRECLDSVKAQTLQKLNLVIIDDCSKDNSLQNATEWLIENGERFCSYILARHTNNLGLSVTRNECFELSKTDYIFVLDADNLIYPRCLSELLSALDNTKASFSYSYTQIFGVKNALLNTQIWKSKIFKKQNYIDAMVLIRKKVWEQIGGYANMNNMGWEDYEMWIKIDEAGGWGVLVPQILCRYRMHNKSMLTTNTNLKIDRLYELLKRMHKDYFVEHADISQKINTVKKSNADANIQVANLQFEIALLEKYINNIKSTRFFYLWQKYCDLRKQILKR